MITAPAQTGRVAVVGIGSVLHGDDGLGPYVVEGLRQRFRFPEGVSLDDVGTPGPGLVHALEDLHAAIIVDAIKGDPPGRVRRYERDALVTDWGGRGGPHDPALAEALLLTELQGRSPCHVVLLGLTIAPPSPGLRLSAPVREGLPALEHAVLGELAQLGVDATPRLAMPGRTWWTED